MRTATASTRHLEQTDHGAGFQARSTSGAGSGSATTAGSVGARSVMTCEGLALVGQMAYSTNSGSLACRAVTARTHR